jgi:hypothetical protein
MKGEVRLLGTMNGTLIWTIRTQPELSAATESYDPLHTEIDIRELLGTQPQAGGQAERLRRTRGYGCFLSPISRTGKAPLFPPLVFTLIFTFVFLEEQIRAKIKVKIRVKTK